jgi:hypothetical protein
MYNDFKFFESTVPYTDLIGLYRFNFTLFPFFITFHYCHGLFLCKKIVQKTPIVKNFLINRDICNNMLIVDVKKDGIEKALKTLKSKVIKTKQNKILFERKEFVKKSVVRRDEILKSMYVQKVKSSLD